MYSGARVQTDEPKQYSTLGPSAFSKHVFTYTVENVYFLIKRNVHYAIVSAVECLKNKVIIKTRVNILIYGGFSFSKCFSCYELFARKILQT